MVRRTKEEALATREKILDAAEWCFMAAGVSGTTIALIAAKAHCTRGAVYWHFRKPADLFRAVADRGRSRLADRLETVLWSPSQVIHALRGCLQAYWKDIQENIHVRNTLEIELLWCDYARPDFYQFRVEQIHEQNQVMNLLRRIFERAAALGELREDVSPAVCAALVGFALPGALRASFMQPSADKYKQIAEAQAVIDAVLSHLACNEQ
ncbi:TetR family transcriptional regulator [Methylobacillus flagellatus]|uniref:TetR family transcriptional regulator n=1 Tax=Methylobacillus flagellatus TaxID=405 RepID=UPI0028539DDF|nr:TetR family transcriptional regulator [Methylobacillus flagellatus]MDR5170987.1 TetR family transcriptional regulator [Methylobacillus flagellatus]